MEDANSFYKQQTCLNACSDAEDSTSFPSFPWFPENNRRRKSRLGTHRNQTRRTFQESTSNDCDYFSSNKENNYDRFSTDRFPNNSAAQVEAQTDELKPSTVNNHQEMSSLSFTSNKFIDQTSPVLSLTRIFDNGMSPLASSFEKSKTMPSSFPSYLAEDEIDGILREINSPDNAGTPLFHQSPSSNKTRISILNLDKSFDAPVSRLTTNHTERKMNKSFSGELPNDLFSISAVENLDFATNNSTEQMNNGRSVAEGVSLNSTNSNKLPRDSSILSSNPTSSLELLNDSTPQPIIENNDLDFMKSNSAILDLGIRNSTELLKNFSPKPETESCSANSVELAENSLLTRNEFSEPKHYSEHATDFSSMHDQESPTEKNFMDSMDLSSMQDQENNAHFQYSNKTNPNLPMDLSSMHDQKNAVNFRSPADAVNFQSSANIVNFQSPADSSNNLPSKEITENIEAGQEISSTELITESMSISSIADIPSTVKLSQASIPALDVHKISSSSMICNSNLEQKKLSEGQVEVPKPNFAVVVPPSEAPRPTVQFVEPAVVREFTVRRNSSKIPASIAVKGKLYRVLNILGSGGSSVVYQVSHPETNELLALKKVELPDEDDEITEGYLNEVQMLENLQNCDVIIKIFDHQLVQKKYEKKTLYVLMEKGDTDLSSLIKSVNESKKLSIPMIVYYWTEMLAAVNEVHRRGIIHSDLKPANFVLVRGRLKLIDFGIASSIQGDVTSVYKDNFCGTLNYMSPEATCFVKCPSGTAGYKITFKADVWSLGCILYNLVYGRLPFQHIKKRMEKIYAIVSPTTNVEFPEKKDVPPILISLLKSCLEKDYKRRPTVQELLDRTMRIFQCSSVD